MNALNLKLRALTGVYCVAKMPADAAIPEWFSGPGFSAAIRADDELTLVCLQDRVPELSDSERDWRCFRSVGPIAFNATGVVQALIAPLSANRIGVFVVCTFDGEHILVPSSDWEKSKLLLKEAGHSFDY